MFNNLFKSKKSDDEIVMSLVVLTYKVYVSLKSLYQDYLEKSNLSERWRNTKITGLNSLTMFLISSQFLLYSNRKNKTKLVDDYTLSMRKKFERDEPGFNDQHWNFFIQNYQTYFQELGKRFTTLLENKSNDVSEFTNYLSHEIFGNDDVMTKIALERFVVFNLVQIKEHIENDLN